jgi:hypothetical protein
MEPRPRQTTMTILNTWQQAFFGIIGNSRERIIQIFDIGIKISIDLWIAAAAISSARLRRVPKKENSSLTEKSHQIADLSKVTACRVV